jgi:hypothetical protein
MVPLSRRASGGENGQYLVTLAWPMMGQWDIDILAAVTGDAGDTADAEARQASEQFQVYVYPVPPQNVNTRTTYASVREYAALAANPERELYIIIPQGTADLVLMGHGEDLIPDQLRLSVTGQNTLVIRNDDIVHHTIGPFYVRAGEVIRQTFYQPAEYKGACSVLHGAEVSIIVEG